LFRALFPLLVFHFCCHHRALHSFPTRRSSDLAHSPILAPHPRTRHTDAYRSPPTVQVSVNNSALDEEGVSRGGGGAPRGGRRRRDRKSTRLNSSHVSISYAVFCLKKKKQHALF